MLFSVAAASLFALGAHARISGIACPEVVKPGEAFNALIITDKYEEVVTDVSISFGYQYEYAKERLGNYVNSYYLNQEYNKAEKFEKHVTIPASEVRGDGVITANLYSLYGKEYRPETHEFKVKVKFGEEVSDKYVYSTY